MRRWVAMLGAALALGACSAGRALPPEQNSLAKRLQPRPQRALVYFHGDPQRSRGAGMLLFVSVNAGAPASPLTAGSPSPGPGVAKLKVFNDTFSLVDTPEGVLKVVVATEDGGVSDPTQRAGPALDLPIVPGRKYYVRVLLDNAPPRSAVLRWRPLGRGAWQSLSLKRVARGVHVVTLPPAAEESIEYYIEAETAGSVRLRWPATAPEICQTVVAMPKS